MKDKVSAELFTAALTAITESYPSAEVIDYPMFVPVKYPAVRIYRFDKYDDTQVEDLSGNDNGVVLAYQCDVLTNKSSGKEKQARLIMEIVEDVFRTKGFRLISSQALNPATSAEYRLTNTWRGAVDKNNYITRR